MAKKTAERTPIKPPVDLGDYLLYNHDKVERAINGTIGREGRMNGGVGKEASPLEVLAEYDKLGGLIRTKDGQKVAMGSFYDFANRKPKETPLVTLAGEKPAGVQVKEENVGDEEPKKKGRKKVEEE